MQVPSRECVWVSPIVLAFSVCSLWRTLISHAKANSFKALISLPSMGVMSLIFYARQYSNGKLRFCDANIVAHLVEVPCALRCLPLLIRIKRSGYFLIHVTTALRGMFSRLFHIILPPEGFNLSVLIHLLNNIFRAVKLYGINVNLRERLILVDSPWPNHWLAVAK